MIFALLTVTKKHELLQRDQHSNSTVTVCWPSAFCAALWKALGASLDLPLANE